MAWMQELRRKRRNRGQQPKLILPTVSLLSCVFRPQAGSPIPGKDKVAMGSLPAWLTPFLSSTRFAPLPATPCNACFFQTSFPGIHTTATYFTGRVCLLHEPGAPGCICSGKSFRTDVPVQFCVLACSPQTGDLPGARLLCLPSDGTLCLLHRTVPPSRQSFCSSHRSCVHTDQFGDSLSVTHSRRELK